MRTILVFVLSLCALSGSCRTRCFSELDEELSAEDLAHAQTLAAQFFAATTLYQAADGVLISPDELTNREVQPSSRKSDKHLRLETATLQRRRSFLNVFIKMLRIVTKEGERFLVNTDQMRNEIAMSRLMSALGWTAKLRGVLDDHDGNFGLVYDYIAGKHLTFPSQIPETLTQRQISNAIKELKMMKQTLHALGIVAYDLQFIVDSRGVFYLVDPADFYFAKGRNKAKALDLGDTEFDNYIQVLEQMKDPNF